MCARCPRELDPGRDGPCRICLWCQHDDLILHRAPEPGAVIRYLPSAGVRQ